MAPWREPYERRRSSTVLREPWGETPRGLLTQRSILSKWLRAANDAAIAPYFIVDDVAATANFYRDKLGFR